MRDGQQNFNLELKAWTSEKKSRYGRIVNVDLEIIFKDVDVLGVDEII